MMIMMWLRETASPRNLRLLLIVVVILRVIIVDPFHIQKSLLDSSKNDGTRSIPNNQQILYYYSIARGDRIGARIHDMLLAHAYAFNKNEELQKINQQQQYQSIVVTNGTNSSNSSNLSSLAYHSIQYGGACVLHSNEMQQTKEMNELLWDLQLNHSLFLACPNNASNEIILDESIYRPYDSTLFTTKWLQSIGSQLSLLHNNKTKSSSSTSTSSSNCTNFHIVAHVRRGDVEPCIYQARFLSNNHYIRLLDKYWPTPDQIAAATSSSRRQQQQVCQNNSNVKVSIFSVSSFYESFDIFRYRNYSVELDTSPFSIIWKALMTADIAILSRSSFSYVPALLNPNTVIYTPFWHAPLSSNTQNNSSSSTSHSGNDRNWIVVSNELMDVVVNENRDVYMEACEILEKAENTVQKRIVKSGIYRKVKKIYKSIVKQLFGS